MRFPFPAVPVLLFLQACTPAAERLQKIESEMLGLLGPAAGLQLSAQQPAFPLPLPPPLDIQAAQKIRARQLLVEAAKIDSTDLEPAQRRLLRQYRQVLTDLSGDAARWPLDPVAYTLAEPLQGALTDLEGRQLAELLEKTSDYYAELERRWRRSNPQQIAAAVAQGLAALDRLEQLEQGLEKYPPAMRARLRAALPAARAGMKNYLGLCRSGVLE